MDDFRDRLLATGLFDDTEYKNNFRLIGTRFFIFTRAGNKFAKQGEWRTVPETKSFFPEDPIPFEVILESIPDELQEQLLFHLDLFS